MNIIITGSLGNISRPLTNILVQQGHQVTVISSNPQKLQAIKALNATPAIGSLEDAEFLAKTFQNADACYAMIPLSFTAPDPQAYMRGIAKNYVQAIKRSNIKNLVILSGWAADLVSDEKIEDIFDELKTPSVSILRPAYFYSNFYMAMDLIKGKGFIGKFLTLQHAGLRALLKGHTGMLLGNFGADDRIVFVAPKDIAAAAAEELNQTITARRIRYVGSEEMTCNQAARIIGAAIGKPWLKWTRISDKQMLQGLKMAKMPQKIAESLVEMQAAMHSGKTLENFHNNNPRLGPTKLTEFAKEFAAAYYAK